MNQLKMWRNKRGLSQWELSSVSGIPRWSIQLIEAAYRCPNPREREALAGALGVTETQLFPREDRNE